MAKRKRKPRPKPIIDRNPEFTSLIEFMDRFPDEDRCRAHLEKMRWPDGPTCVRCGGYKKIYRCGDGKRLKCGECHRYFTVTVGTIFHDSHLPLRKWFIALYLLTSSKKGIPSTQLGRILHVRQQTAWYMLQRLRMMVSQFKTLKPFDGIVEIDEKWLGGDPRKGSRKKERPKFDKNGKKIKKKNSYTKKLGIFGIVSRDPEVRPLLTYMGQGVSRRRSITHPIIKRYVKSSAKVMTDSASVYNDLNQHYDHESVNHSKGEYVRGNVHTNSVEGLWGLIERSKWGVYHKITERHITLYLDEFTFRYWWRLHSDSRRFNEALKMCEGLLRYRDLVAADYYSNQYDTLRNVWL